MKTAEEIHNLVAVMRISALKDLRDLSAINCGSAHKSKDEIVRQVCDTSREAAAFQELILNCIEYVNAGYTIESYISMKAQEISSTSNLCNPDKIRNRELLDRLMGFIIEVA